MPKKKRKLTAAERAAKKKRREEYRMVFINGKMKRVRRDPMIGGLTVDEFIRQNADPIFLHAEEMWWELEEDDLGDSVPKTDHRSTDVTSEDLPF
jgi:hypothetical protein